MSKAQENIAAIAKALPIEFIKGLGAINAQLASERTIRFDLGKPGNDGINRVKVTKDGDAFMVRFYEVKEVEMLYSVPAENLQAAISNVIGKVE